MGTENQNWLLELDHDQWIALPVTGPRPSARYKHAAAVVGEKLYIVGGSRNGRYLSDFQVFDLNNLTWSSIKLNVDPSFENIEHSSPEIAFPAISSHNMIKWENRLIIVGGQTKNISDRVTVRFINLESHLCGVIETTGDIPISRSGQSVSLVGSKLIMFGGEDKSRRLLNDVHVLDLETMSWSDLETTQTSPAPRFDHTAAVHGGRYLLIFGGCSHSVFYGDLNVLDLETMEWSQPEVQGEIVAPRAGHAGVTVDDKWYIVGGGDNRSGAQETLALNMSKLVLSVLTSVKARDPLASEGLSVSSSIIHGEKFLVAFGGYNGKYNNEVYVMRPKSNDSTHAKIFKSPAAAAAAASVTAAYALTTPEKAAFTDTRVSNIEVDLSLEIKTVKEDKKLLESSLSEIQAENSALQAKLDETSSTHVDLSKELQSVQGQLVAERSRCAKLEAQIAELQKMLVSLQSIEEEVQEIRRQKAEFDRDVEVASAVQRQSSGGVWRWVAG
ncbi:hypothetical protein AgCh_039707 [Apium graveolens]